MKTLCTIIVPSKGRPTLANTLQTICLQNPIKDHYLGEKLDYNACVCFDDVDPIIECCSSLESPCEIQAIRTPQKLGVGVNGAGNVRNYAIEHMAKLNKLGMYIGFVDDDDVLSLNYINKLSSACHDSVSMDYVLADVIIFRMQYSDGFTLPPLGETDISRLENKIGISFAIKSDIFLDGYKFSPSSGEDYEYLKGLWDMKLKFHFTNEVGYYVSPLGVAKDRL